METPPRMHSELMELAPDAMFVADERWRCVTANELGRRLLEASPEDAVGRDLAAFFEVREDGCHERRVRRGDGGWGAVELSVRTLPGGQRVIVCRDLTERQRNMNALLSAEARYRAMMSAVPDFLFRLDRAGHFLDVVTSDESRLAFPPEAFLGKTVEEVFGSPASPFADPKAMVRDIRTALAATFATGRLQRFEYAYGTRWFEARLIKAGIDDVLAIATDISERRHAEELLRATLASRDDLLAIVSHDLRSPLSSIQLATSHLALSAERDRHPVEVIQRSVDRMCRLIDDLLDVGLIDAGRFVVVSRPERLAPIVEEVLEQLTTLAADRDVRLVAEVSKSLPSVVCDRARVVQLLSNLIGNALKFTPAGGEVVVGGRIARGQLCLSVADTGPGIAQQDLVHIFERHWRGDTRSAERAVGKQAGFGLGLYIAKGIAEAHHGKLWAQSEPGRGATFYVTFPLAVGLELERRPSG